MSKDTPNKPGLKALNVMTKVVCAAALGLVIFALSKHFLVEAFLTDEEFLGMVAFVLVITVFNTLLDIRMKLDDLVDSLTKNK